MHPGIPIPATILVLVALAPVVAFDAEALPNDTYVGADPTSVTMGRPDPYAGFEDYAVCFGAATLQVQRNSAGTWDVLIRRAAVAPSLTPNYPLETNLNSLERCPFESGAVYTITGATGSPSAGITKASGSSYSGWSLRVDPFTTGGPALAVYEQHCSQYVCGAGSGYAWELRVYSQAMG